MTHRQVIQVGTARLTLRVLLFVFVFVFAVVVLFMVVFVVLEQKKARSCEKRSCVMG